MALLTFVFMLLAAPQSKPFAAAQSPFAGSLACQGCHVDMYTKWSDSIHGRMIQRANSKTVVSHADFSGGPATKKSWRNGTLYIEENGVENRIDYTLGNRRIQHYLTTKPNGEIHVMRTTWDVKRQEWLGSNDHFQNA